MRTPDKVYINLNFDSETRQSIINHLSEYDVHFGDSESFSPEDEKKFLESAIMFGWCDSKLLESNTNLKWIQLDSVGYGQYQNVKWKDSSVHPRVTNLRFLFADFVAETAIAGLLAYIRGVPALVQLKQERTWNQLGMRKQISTLTGKKVLIAGMGGIGQAVKSRLCNFKCEISTYGNSLETADFVSHEELDRKIIDTDILIICLPENSSTIGLFDSTRLHQLKKSAVVINVGRGSVLDEEVLISLLSSNKIAFAILDVTQKEPLLEKNILWDLPNVLLTQHTGGGVHGENLLKLEFFLENLQLFSSGSPLLNEIIIG
jgi:phosphoglycerate dehydrogenase-like enzyme